MNSTRNGKIINKDVNILPNAVNGFTVSNINKIINPNTISPEAAAMQILFLLI